jgi:hypothetical protein
VSSDELAAIGAFLSGAGSVISAAWYVRRQRRKAESDCQRRIEEIDRAIHEGIAIGRERDEDRQPR